MSAPVCDVFDLGCKARETAGQVLAGLVVLRRKRTTLDRLRNRAASLASRGGPAVLAGALDATDSLTPSDLRTAIETCLKGGRGQVRKVALQVMAERVDSTEAVRMARVDPDASIRRWAPTLETESGTTTLF